VLVDKIAIVVDDYDQAIRFFTGALGFDLAEDSPALTTEGGRPKRWVVVRPPGAETGILLARADGERQAAAVGNQVAGRVGFFLQVEDFGAAYRRRVRHPAARRTVRPGGGLPRHLWQSLGPHRSRGVSLINNDHRFLETGKRRFAFDLRFQQPGARLWKEQRQCTYG
jgi:catechol 2,3-dioxygenase-like lactoylglutathione lyase family enzyme